MEIFTKDFIKGYFARNKKLILLSLAIFLIFFIIGAIMGRVGAGDNYGAISKAIMESTSPVSISDISGDSIGLFIHNLTADLIVFFFGIFFSIISVLIVIFNAISIGVPFGNDFFYASVTIIPHAIFEYLGGTTFALTVAFLITKFEITAIKKRSIKQALADSYFLKDLLFSVILVVIFLAIAAVIEGHITPQVMMWAFGK